MYMKDRPFYSIPSSRQINIYFSVHTKHNTSCPALKKEKKMLESSFIFSHSYTYKYVNTLENNPQHTSHLDNYHCIYFGELEA